MILLIGAFIVALSVFGGFVIGGGQMGTLVHVSGLVMIGGAGLGALIMMSPRKILVDLCKGTIDAFRGTPYSRAAYDELFKLLYELFLIGRRSGMIALEEHIANPTASPIFKKYPGVHGNTAAVEFLCGGLRPLIDGKIKPDQLRHLLEIEIDRMDEEYQGPVSVLTRAADAMPGFGIVAAVLGIVITMSSIAGPIEEIGAKVASALVGTFLGIFMSYGFMNPLAVNMEFVSIAQLNYFRVISTCVVGFAGGMAPLMAVEMGRRGLSTELRPTGDELENLLKGSVTSVREPLRTLRP